MKEIRNIIAQYDAGQFGEDDMALATVVNVEASSYRRIGARMLVASSGNWTGGISGGCLEGDALKRSQKAIFSKTASTVVYDTMEDDQNQIGIGLGCNGKIDVLFTPIDKNDLNNPIELLRNIEASKEPSVLITIIESDDDPSLLAYSEIANSVQEDTKIQEIFGDKLSSTVALAFSQKRAQVVNVVSKQNQNFRVLIEFVRPETKLIIIGDNYDVSALVGITKELGWETTIVGRKKKMSKQIFSAANQVLEYEQIESLKRDDYTAISLMTHDFNWDKKILPALLSKNFPYLGILGPKKRMDKLIEELSLSDDQLSSIHAPIGLDIGAETPEEIASSIVAEILAVFRQRDAGFLKNRIGSIHS